MPEIDSILHLYPPDCQPTQSEPLGSAGGMSGAQFWRITAQRGALILRRWPQEHPTPQRLQFIHAVLRHAAERGIAFLPVPIRATTGESFVLHAEHLWELAPWMPGTADYERAPSVERLQAAMRALASFHNAVAGFDRESNAPSPAITRRLAMLHELQSGGRNQLAQAITPTTWPDLAPLAHTFVSALPAAIPRAIAQLAPLADVPFRLQPCLRDIWRDHVLFTGDEVTGIIDFGALDIDTPAGDVARLLGSLAGSDATDGQSGLAAYSAIRRLSAEETRAVATLDTSGTVLAGCNWLRWIYIDGRQFENRAQVIEHFRRIVARLIS